MEYKQINEGELPADTSFGYISVFRLHLSQEPAVHLFHDADKNWLYFVSSNRRKALFPEIREKYASFDIIGEKIANDRTALTLQLYTTGAYGEPGSDQADNIAITTLLPNRLEDQFCFCIGCCKTNSPLTNYVRFYKFASGLSFVEFSNLFSIDRISC